MDLELQLSWYGSVPKTKLRNGRLSGRRPTKSLNRDMKRISQKTPTPKQRSEANHILGALPPQEYQALLPKLQRTDLLQDQVLYDVGSAITAGYFVLSGLVSCLTVMQSGQSVEVGLFGDEGFAGLPILLNIAHSSTRIIIQIPGEALRIDASTLHSILPGLPMLERMLSRFTYLQALQAQQIAACNRLHEVEERLARWLLMTQDRVQGSILPLTHDLLAHMLGTRRSSVTVAAGMLQKAGIIDYRRGKVHVLDREKLEQSSCECYGVVRMQLDTYLQTSTAARPRI